jgi:hydroxymethylbilane synthase
MVPMVPIATRGSALARWQADHVAALVHHAGAAAGHDVEPSLVVVETTGDQRLDVALWEIGGKGVFVKEVQAAVLDGRARLAVHSAKDLPAHTPDGLVLAAVPERGDPRDVLVGATLDGLGPGATVATGSVRRRVQLADRRPDLTFTGLRGNIATRLDKVPPGGAVVVAAAALDRLGLHEVLVERGLATEVLDSVLMVPQVAQGALAVECRADDGELLALLAGLDHAPTRRAVDAERAFLAELGGDCDLPAGAHAVVDHGDPLLVSMHALLASLDGHVVLRAHAEGPDPEALGRGLARHLLDAAGGSALLTR